MTAILACAALVVTLGLQFFLPYSGPPVQSSLLAPRRPHLVTTPLLPEYAAILKAPLFAPDRHPGDIGPNTAGALGAYAALGSISGGSAAAAVLSGPGGSTKTLRTGETLEGWRLAAVDRTKLTFERNGQKHILVIGEPAEAVIQSTASPSTDQPPAAADQ